MWEGTAPGCEFGRALPRPRPTPPDSTVGAVTALAMAALPCDCARSPVRLGGQTLAAVYNSGYLRGVPRREGDVDCTGHAAEWGGQT